jgi:uncharacterized protein YdhG (YjbR/CyaY superfamily)
MNGFMKKTTHNKRKSNSRAEKADGETAVITKLAEMSEHDRAMGVRIHEIIKTNAPELTPRLWYGMPAYSKEGKVICFFQNSQKFKTRYATLGFSDKAILDEGNMWPTSYAIMELTDKEQTIIASLIKKALKD